MNVEISIRHMATSYVVNQMIKDLCNEVNNKYENIKNIDVIIEDINGPYKAGVDKRCHLKVRGSNHLAIDIDDVDEDISHAIERAFQHLIKLLKTYSYNKKRRFGTGAFNRNYLINASGECYE
ncbi:MAG: hypothetical protein COA54_09075 [Thiotrichaceae bacterium]|nr:MAG: hypothetical protein COA54_09075 [Thiotrichaceae bacterium]